MLPFFVFFSLCVHSNCGKGFLDWPRMLLIASGCPEQGFWLPQPTVTADRGKATKKAKRQNIVVSFDFGCCVFWVFWFWLLCLLIASTATVTVEDVPSSVFFSSAALSCLAHHTPLKLSICWHCFKIKGGDWEEYEISSLPTRQWCVPTKCKHYPHIDQLATNPPGGKLLQVLLFSPVGDFSSNVFSI